MQTNSRTAYQFHSPAVLSESHSRSHYGQIAGILLRPGAVRPGDFHGNAIEPFARSDV